MSELTNNKKLKSKSIFLAVCCLCFASYNIVYAQGKVCKYKETDIESLNGKVVLKSIKQPVDGVVCNYNANGDVVVETPYKNGVVEGVERRYNKQGKLLTEIPYNGFLIEGIAKTYNDGKLLSEIPYKNGSMEGIYKEYDENRKLKTEVLYKGGKREGYYLRYTETGELYYKILYENDKAISGTCGGNGRTLNNAEFATWFNYGYVVSCP